MSPIRVIVAGVADAQAQDPTLAAAAEMAQHTGAELHVVHAYSLPSFFSISPGLEYVDPWGAEQFATAAQEAFEATVRRRYAMERLHVHALAGPADRLILDLAERHHADLVVVGATRRGRIARAILGTTAQRVLRGASAPVFVVRQLHTPAERVLLTTDLSSTGADVHERGLEVVEALYGRGNSALRLLLVIMEGMAPPPLPRDAIERIASAELSEFLAERAARPHTPEPVLRFGIPAAEITAEAERWKADLVVLGTHNRPTLPRILLGSVAEASLRDLHCNALVIPPRAEAAPAREKSHETAGANAE